MRRIFQPNQVFFTVKHLNIFIYINYIHDKITAIWLVKRSAIISLIALSKSAIDDFRDGWGEREIKTTKSNMAAKFR
jgi:hypothetical protein